MIIPPAQRLAQTEEYYFAGKLREIRAMQAAGHPIINMGIGNPDLPPHPSVVAALKESASQPNHHGYQPYRGAPVLREAMAEWMQHHYKVSLSSEKEILPLMGSKEGIMHVMQAFTNPGDSILVPDPGYPTYQSVSRLCQVDTATYHYHQTDWGWEIDLDSITQHDLAKVKIMWLNEPHMPTGALSNPATLARLLDLAQKHQFLVVNDNPYGLILNPNPHSILSLPGARDLAMELHSTSKIFNMAGWRVGWLAGHSDLLDTIIRVKSNMDSGMFLPVQEAAAVALRLPVSWYETQNTLYAERRGWVSRLFDALGLKHEAIAPGLFVWGSVPDERSAEEWSDWILKETDVFITPGHIFGAAGQRHLRASLCVPTDQLKAATERIEKLMQST